MLTGDWLTHPATQSLLAGLEAAGFAALFVGGCVRNALLGVPVLDTDLATDARPETVSNIARSLGFRSVPTGILHGTVTILAGGRALEVTTFRRDAQTDGRHAVVAFTSDVATDAARRDFTMNALYADRHGQIIDPLGGLPDLLAARVRFVGDPDQRITEDYLRILRFFRFHAHYGDPAMGIDAEGLAACAAHADQIPALSRERIGAEMRKLLAAPDPAPSVASMAQAGVLAQVLPGADPTALAPLVHLESGIPPRWQRRLAVIGGQDPAGNLRLSRKEARDLGLVRDEIGTTHTPAALGWLLKPDLAQDAILARAALLEAPLPPHWRADIARGATARLPVTATDLQPAHQGAQLGARLKDIQARWLASDLTLAKHDLLD
ncbi:MAG: CCA tRNA nucleotidyltransferase [Pseudomonadota bacterium]